MVGRPSRSSEDDEDDGPPPAAAAEEEAEEEGVVLNDDDDLSAAAMPFVAEVVAAGLGDEKSSPEKDRVRSTLTAPPGVSRLDDDDDDEPPEGEGKTAAIEVLLEGNRVGDNCGVGGGERLLDGADRCCAESFSAGR